MIFRRSSALRISVNCINHLQSARTITVHPFDTGVCSHVISDKHWLRENALCLLSNAMKYSHDGAVDLRIKLIHATADPSGSSNQNKYFSDSSRTSCRTDPLNHPSYKRKISLNYASPSANSASSSTVQSGAVAGKIVVLYCFAALTLAAETVFIMQ